MNEQAPTRGGEALFRTRPWLFLLTAGAPYAVLLVVALILLPGQGWTGVLVVAAVLLGAIAKISGRVFELRRLREPWTVRIGPDGVMAQPWPGQLRWGQLVEVRIKNRRAIWAWLIPSGVKLITRAELDFSRRAGSKPLGMTIDTRYLDGDEEDVLAAIRRFADVPVVRT